jgi:hypothetical protein
MSLKSYQTAPPRDLERAIITAMRANANGEFAPRGARTKYLPV